MAGPSYANVTQLGAGPGKLAGLSTAETFDLAARERQSQAQTALSLDTTRLAQQRSGQLLEENELKLRKLRDLEAYRKGANVSGGGATVANAPGGINYTGSVVSGTRAPTFDPAAVQAGANYTQSNYEAAAFGGTPPVEITPEVAPDTTGQPLPMRDAAKLVKDLEPVWANLEGRFGLPEGYLRRTAEIESSLDPNAQNPDSSAGGLFQFLDATAAEFNLTDKFDPVQASNAAAKLASRNAKILAGVLGRQPTAGELYLAHQQGAGGASVLLDPANQDKRAVDVVSDPQFVLLNGGDENMSVAKFVKKWGKEKWAGMPYTYAQRQALNLGEGPAGLKGNFYSYKKGMGYAQKRYLDERRFEGSDPNLATGKMDFSFPSPAIAKEAAVLYPSGEEVLAAAAETGARPGQRPLPATTGGTFTLTQLDVPIIIPPSLTPVNYVEYNPTTQEIRGLDGRPIPEAYKAQALEGAAYNFNESAQNNVDSLTGRVAALKTELDSASPTEYAGKLQTYTDTLAQLNNAKAQLDGSYSELPGSLRLDRNVFSGEGPEAGITSEVEKANLKKLKENEAKRLETEKAATAAFNAANSTLRQNAPTSPEGKKAINTAIEKLQAGLNTTGKGDADGTVKPQASVYSLDPAKLFTATQALEVAATTRATLVRQQALHRMAGNLEKEMQVELKIQELDANVISTNSYLKGMDVIRELKGGDLMPFVNLMANTFKTNDVELRETDGKWTLFVNGQENPTVKSMTQNDIAEYVGYLFDEDYKAATQAVGQSTVEFQRELMLESHKAALTATTELAKATNKAQTDVILERLKNSGKYQVVQTRDGEAYLGKDENGSNILLYPEYTPPGLDVAPSPAVFIQKNGNFVPLQSN